MSFTKENAKAASAEGLRVRREKAAQRKADPAGALVAKFEAALPQLGADLLAAAKGEGQWKQLPVDKRLAALFRALEYGLGRPVARGKAPPTAEVPEPEPDGLTIE